MYVDERLEDFILTKLDQKQTNKPNIIEQLGQCMNEAGNEFGSTTQYGSTLIKCGQTHQKLGGIYKDFFQSSAIGYIQPLRSFLEGEMKSIMVMRLIRITNKYSINYLERTSNFRNETFRS